VQKVQFFPYEPYKSIIVLGARTHNGLYGRICTFCTFCTGLFLEINPLPSIFCSRQSLQEIHT
jgi:hypothetical protein